MSERHRLELRCSSGNPRETTIHLDGEQLTFVSRVELVLDVNGETTAKLTVPGALLEIDADVAAFVEAHGECEPQAVHVNVTGHVLTDAMLQRALPDSPPTTN